MLKCPVCSADLAKLAEFPDACPGCGYRLARPESERGSVQLISDSAESKQPEIDAPMQSDDSSLIPAGSKSENPDDDPSNSKTFVSDEWENPDNSLTVHSEEFEESPPSAEAVDKTVQFDESDDPTNVKTMQSEEFALENAAGSGEGLDRTVVSDEWDFRRMGYAGWCRSNDAVG
jgi:hypothetical protein